MRLKYACTEADDKEYTEDEKKENFFKELVKMTPGYVGADVSTLCKEASIQAVSRIIHSQSDNINLTE